MNNKQRANIKIGQRVNIEPYCLLRTPRMAGTIKPGGVDNERKTI